MFTQPTKGFMYQINTSITQTSHYKHLQTLLSFYLIILCRAFGLSYKYIKGRVCFCCRPATVTKPSCDLIWFSLLNFVWISSRIHIQKRQPIVFLLAMSKFRMPYRSYLNKAVGASSQSYCILRWANAVKVFFVPDSLVLPNSN